MPIISQKGSSGGGSIPSWWTFDDTGHTAQLDGTDGTGLNPTFDIIPPANLVDGSYLAFRIQKLGGSMGVENDDLFTVEADATVWLHATPGQGDPYINLTGDSGSPGQGSRYGNGFLGGSSGTPVIKFGISGGAGSLGFFGATEAAKPTGVAVTAAGIHAALVTLGLIAP